MAARAACRLAKPRGDNTIIDYMRRRVLVSSSDAGSTPAISTRTKLQVIS